MRNAISEGRSSMNRGSPLILYLIILIFSFLGLLLSGFFWGTNSSQVTIAAIVGTIIIATAIWLPLCLFLKKYQEKE